MNMNSFQKQSFKTQTKGRKSFRNFSPQRQHTERRQVLIPINPIIYKEPFNPKEFVVAQCSEKDIEIFKYIFDYFDSDQDGRLTPLDFRKVFSYQKIFQHYGYYKPQKKFIYRMISEFDVDQLGQINFKEFVKMMTTKLCQQDQIQQINRVFDSIDSNNKGYLDIQDIKALQEDITCELSTEDIIKIIEKCDPKGKGKITREGFIAFNKRKKF